MQAVPQCSILGPLLFNIYINDLFFALEDVDIRNFADDTTPFVCDRLKTNVLKNEKIMKKSQYLGFSIIT